LGERAAIGIGSACVNEDKGNVFVSWSRGPTGNWGFNVSVDGKKVPPAGQLEKGIYVTDDIMFLRVYF